MLDRTERFTIEHPKKDVGLKTSHDKQDLVELPKFINFACDMGLIADPDDIKSMSPKPDLPPQQKASVSDAETNKDRAKELSVEVGQLSEQEDIRKSEEPQKSLVVEKKPSIQSKETDLKPEKKSGRHHWGTLKKSLSKVRCLIAF